MIKDPDDHVLYTTRGRGLRKIAFGVLLLCGFIQCFLEPSFSNLTSVAIIVSASGILIAVVCHSALIKALPLPTLVVLGFNVATMSGALLAQTLALKPVTYNLQVPVITFGFSAAYQFSLTVALYWFYSARAFKALSRLVNRRVISAMGLMNRPTDPQLWIMGAIGSLSMAVTGSLGLAGEIQYGDVGLKFLVGLNYLAFAPFLIPILGAAFPGDLQSTKSLKITKTVIVLLFAYLLLLLLIAMARNSRGAFASGLANLGMASFLLLLIGQLKFTRRLAKQLLTATFALILAFPLLNDLAVAMLVVRDQRSELTSAQLIQQTVSALAEKDSLDNYRKATLLRAGGGFYEEHYIDNIFLSRFIQTKFFDNSLSYETVRKGDHSQYFLELTGKKVLAILPTPALRALGIELDKNDLEFSFGDALFERQSGIGFGGYRTGSPVAHGYAIVSASVFIFAVPLYLIAFVALQSLTRHYGVAVVVFCPVILLQLMSVYSLAVRDSMLDPIYLAFRTVPQDVIIYWAVFHATSIFGRLMPTRGSRVAHRHIV